MTKRKKKKYGKHLSELDQISTTQIRGKLVQFHETDPPTWISMNLAVILAVQAGRLSVSAIQKHLLSYSQYGQALTIARKMLSSRSLSSHAPDDELDCPCCSVAVRICLLTTLVLLQVCRLKELKIYVESSNTGSMGNRFKKKSSSTSQAVYYYEFTHWYVGTTVLPLWGKANLTGVSQGEVRIVLQISIQVLDQVHLGSVLN